MHQLESMMMDPPLYFYYLSPCLHLLYQFGYIGYTFQQEIID